MVFIINAGTPEITYQINNQLRLRQISHSHLFNIFEFNFRVFGQARLIFFLHD